MEDVETNSEKSFDIELSTDKNNSYSLNFISAHSLDIIANQINSLFINHFQVNVLLKKFKQ